MDEIEEKKGLNFTEIDRMRNQGLEVQRRLRGLEKLNRNDVAIELKAIFNTNHSDFQCADSIWLNRADIFIQFARERTLGPEDIKDLFELFTKLIGKLA